LKRLNVWDCGVMRMSEVKLEDIVDKIAKIGFRRNMKYSDIEAIVESVKHLYKKLDESPQNL
jgi:hypothetical protein